MQQDTVLRNAAIVPLSIPQEDLMLARPVQFVGLELVQVEPLLVELAVGQQALRKH